MTAAKGPTGTSRHRSTLVPDPAPPRLSLTPPLVERNGWNWVDRDQDDVAAMVIVVEDFVTYFNARYGWTTDHLIPPCWSLHGALVEEITTLMWSRWSAFQSPNATPEAAQTWHTYYLPPFLTRINTWLGSAAAECRSGNHQPSSIRGRRDDRGRPIREPRDPPIDS